MPPGRPRGRPAKNTTHSSATAGAAPQSRLSFGPKNAANKITKPAATTQLHSPKDKKLPPKQKHAIADAAKAQISEPSSPSSSSSDHDDDEPQQQTHPAAEEPETQAAAQHQHARARKQNNKPLPIPIRSSGGADLANASKLGPRDSKEVEASKISDAQIKKYWKRKEDDRIAARVHQRGLSVHEKVLREFDLSSQFGRADGLGLKPPLEVLAVLMKEEGLERAYVDELMGKTLGGLDA
ncbi:MAG: hypothetical protein OHK93_005708 [Ramalina farinacea]|uniref:Uncharacterized protein n=1 Tax=Ramalina farinacea TaxID=258253 RepID=A0AA43TSW0_9LECA|nr:hypothetical protein [Ramalina farinacea]